MRAKFIYEKFSEESDPIEDLGIGIYYFDLEYANVYDLEEGLKEEIEGYDIKIQILETNSNYTTVRTIGSKNNLIKYITDVFIKNPSYAHEIISKLKPLTESLDEKFKENSDPVEDLGIGLIGKLQNIHTKQELIEKFPDTERVAHYVSRSIYSINKDKNLFVVFDHDATGPKPHYFMDYTDRFNAVRIFKKSPDGEEITIWYKPYD
jgi:hypothetical protein